MAVPVIAATTQASASNDATATINKPTGLATGELLLCVDVATHTTSSPSASLPSGFSSAIARADGWGGGTLTNSLLAARKTISNAGSEGSAYTFDWTGGGTELGTAAILCRISGGDPVNPINTSAGATGTSTTITFPSVTTTVGDCLIVLMAYCFADAPSGSQFPNVVPSGTTSADHLNSGQASLAVAYASKTTAGSTGTYTVAAPSNVGIWQALTVAIAPYVTGTGSAALTVRASGAGAVGLTGTGSASLRVTATAAGAVGVSGSGAASLRVTATGSGVSGSDVIGSGSVQLAITALGSGLVGVTGTGTVSLSLSATASGVVSLVTGYPWHPPTVWFPPPTGWGPPGFLFAPIWGDPPNVRTTWTAANRASTSWTTPTRKSTVWRS